jgi:hypothetical protein
LKQLVSQLQALEEEGESKDHVGELSAPTGQLNRRYLKTGGLRKEK